MSKLGDIWIQLGLKKQGFDKGLKDAQSSTKTFGNKISKALTGAAGKFLTVTAAVKVLGDSVKSLAQFERANSTLASVLGTTTAGIKELTASAKDLGRQTEFTSSQVTQLQTELARLGFVKSDILDMQGSVLKFAAAVGTDLASAASFAGGSLRTFGLSTKDTQDMLDIMADSTSKSALSFLKLETSMGIVFPIAKTFGLSVADTVAMLGALNNVMPDSSMAATAFRNILLNLADSNGKLAQGLGHTAKTFPEIVAALEELSARGVDLNEVLGMSDTRSAAALASFIQNTKALKDLRQAFDESTGSVDRMYETMTDNLIGSVRALKSAWEGLILTWQSSTGPMKSVVDWLATMINKLTDFNTAAQTGGKSRKDKDEENALWSRFKYIGDTQGKEEMVRVFNQWLKDAETAYDSAIDAYNNYKSRKNKKAMTEHGNAVMNLSDISQKVMSYEPSSGTKTNNALIGSAPTGSGRHQLTEEEKDQRKAADAILQRAQDAAKTEVELLTEKYETEKALLEAFGMETETLTQEYYDNLLGDVTAEIENELSAWESELEPIEITPITLDTDAYNEQWEDFLESYERNEQKAQMLTNTFSNAVAAGFSGACQELFDQLHGLSEANGGAILQALLTPLAEMAITSGETIMAAGIGVEAFKSSLLTLNGVPAIAAGAALIAIGTACKSGLAALASSGSASSATSTSNASSATSSVGTEKMESELTVYVKGTIKGSDIVIAGNNTLNQWSR